MENNNKQTLNNKEDEKTTEMTQNGNRHTWNCLKNREQYKKDTK